MNLQKQLHLNRHEQIKLELEIMDLEEEMTQDSSRLEEIKLKIKELKDKLNDTSSIG